MARQYSRIPLMIAGIYAFIGCLWILLSDRAVELFTSDPATITRISMFKGWMYVLLTALLLYWLIRRQITAVRLSEDRLRNREEKFYMAFNYSPVLMAISTIDDGSYIEVNERFCQVSGFSRQECLGRTSVETGWISAAGRERMMRVLRRNGRVTDMEIELTAKDGSAICSLFSAEIVTIGGEQFLLSIVLDITRRKEAEKALKESEERYRRFSSITSDYIYSCRRSGTGLFRTQWMAGAVEEITGISQEQIADSGCWLPLVHPEDVGRVKQRQLDLKPGDTSTDEFRIVRKDGEIRWIREVCRCEAGDAPGELVRLGASQDITERKEAEAALRDLNEHLEQLVKERTAELEQSNEELATFCYAISHELRAPIVRIQGFSTILGEICNGDDEKAFMASRIEKACIQLQTVVDSILMLSNLSKAKLSLQQVDLSQVAARKLGLLLDEHPERTVAVDIMPGVTAVADPDLLEICLDNLISNAFKFTGQAAEARIEVGSFRESGREVYFVRDNGTGFDTAYAEQLYAPFQRLHQQKEFPGTGIGLATVKRIVNRHGGEIWAESRVGQGATFYFTLGCSR